MNKYLFIVIGVLIGALITLTHRYSIITNKYETSIDNIKAVYNKFSEGGFLDKGDDEKYYALHPELRGRLRTYPPKPNKEDVKSDVVVVIN